MLKKTARFFQDKLQQQVPSTGLGLLRIFYGLVLFQEILFLLYFNHLIFDPVPFIDVEFPLIPLFLCLWSVIGLMITVGYRYQSAMIINYVFWLVFVSFTPMQRDFDGGFDQFMTGVGFLLIFLPANRAFSLDLLRYKLQFSDLRQKYQPIITTSILSYYVPVVICLGFLYFDSGIHKLSSDHWRNGLGAWLPSSIPYYISAIDMSWLLNQEILQKAIGYTIIVFQFSFFFLYFSKKLRPIALLVGMSLHLGITFSFNIYPFGLGMLALYPLLVPFSWWKKIGDFLSCSTPLSVYYDEDCPLCNKTVIVLQHFDIFSAIEFKGLQTYASNESALKTIEESQLLNDLYAVNTQGKLYQGVDTYLQILIKMRYTALIGAILAIPGIYHISRHIYRGIADNRQRCDERCEIIEAAPPLYFSLYEQYFETNDDKQQRKISIKLAKLFMLFCLLQLNSTVHYGIIYRLDINPKNHPATAAIAAISNTTLSLTHNFIGLTPHALYLHDHFKGYDHILGITYYDANNNEKWLPFVNEQGRIIAPNWGRVHSMWANIAVTPNINQRRLEKFIMKVTAFWGTKIGLDLNNANFIIKAKSIKAPATWEYNLRKNNLSQPWHNIGIAQWKNRQINIQFLKNLKDY